MSVKRFYCCLLAIAAMAAAPALAHQRGPQPGTHITVAKAASNLGDYKAMYSSIQEAVNNAQPGQVIEILDEAEYAEQVTIDGREDRRWPAPTGGLAPVGGKNNIAIKYVPPPNAALSARPSIKYQDQTNTSPRTCAEARTQGDAVGASGNFETNAALRIIRASGIVIDGLIIDGGGSRSFSYANVWQDAVQGDPTACPGTGRCTDGGENDPKIRACPLFHGNAAITLAISHNVQIRDCQIRNAYLGIYVKDRNTGGIFGNPNPSDNDVTIPLSGFGQTGNHLIEYNRIHTNDVGLFFESCWDLASTVRYNLIYSNGHSTAPSGSGSLPDKAGGAIIFKDIYLTPLAIYNNTFHQNTQHLVGLWQVGFQHLIFNNIFGRLTANRPENWDESRGSNPYDYITIEDRFPNRMKHSVWASDVNATGTFKNFTNVSSAGGLITGSKNNRTTPATNPFPTATAGAVNPPANVKWLETTFQSTTATATNFLEPDWNNSAVNTHIKNKGWATNGPGILNADGSAADIGAIPSDPDSKRPCDGKQQTSRGRVSPYGFVTITGGTAIAKISISQEVGTLSDLKVKYIRWISPVPDNADKFGHDEPTPIAGTSIREATVTNPTGGWQVGANQVNIGISGTAGVYGFFEIVFEGKDANGNTVTTDVGFLPYRQLEYYLDIKLSGSGVTTPTGGVPTVQAGTAVTMTVTAMNRATGARFTGGSGSTQSTNPLIVAYSLSLITSRIFQTPGDAPLEKDDIFPPSGTYTKDYTVYFTKAGDEVITGAGLWCNGDCDDPKTTSRLPFPGDALIKVRPGPPDKVVFQDPIPKSQLGSATPATIIGTYPVTVQVQDKYDNAVDIAVPVEMVSLKPEIGGVRETVPVNTDAATGNASFTAIVTNGKTSDVFDLRAAGTGNHASITPDTGSLRVGREADMLYVFYGQSSPAKHGASTGGKGGWWVDDQSFDWGWPEDSIPYVGTRKQVWVKVVSNAGDTVVTTKQDAQICVTASDPNIQFSATEAGTFASGPYVAPAVANGVTTFWITSEEGVTNASLTVGAKTTADCGGEKDNSIADGTRGEITFAVPPEPPEPPAAAGEIDSVYVKGDGYARPDSVWIKFNDKGAGGNFNGVFDEASGETVTWSFPDSVTLKWPCSTSDAVRNTGVITKLDSVRILAVFPAGSFPADYSAPPPSSGAGLLTVYGAVTGDTSHAARSLTDNIGPLIARSRDDHCGAERFSNPTFAENTKPGEEPYVLRIRVTEALGSKLFVGPSLFISQDSLGTGEKTLTVASVRPDGEYYELTLALTDTLYDGRYIKFNPAHTGITDVGGNAPHAGNRRVRIGQKAVAPTPLNAWYSTNDADGLIDYVYIVFDKNYEDDWFKNGGKFTFNWGTEATERSFTLGAENGGAVTLLAGTENTIRIDMRAAFPEVGGLTRGVIRTGGNIIVDYSFAPAKGDDVPWNDEPGLVKNRSADDRARPVLVRAQLRRGIAKEVNGSGEFWPDTLVLTFSETMNANVTSLSDPVVIKSLREWTNGLGAGVTALPPTVSGVYQVVSYVLPTDGAFKSGDPMEGDSIRINHTAGAADDKDNIQTTQNNHAVPLELIPSPPLWGFKVKNNPFGRGEGRENIEIVSTPNIKGKELQVTAVIRVFDNMGNLVVVDTAKNTSNPAPNNPNAVRWTWDGRTRLPKGRGGRFVGTGTYIYRAVITITEKDGKPVQGLDRSESTRVDARSLGFVR